MTCAPLRPSCSVSRPRACWRRSPLGCARQLHGGPVRTLLGSPWLKLTRCRTLVEALFQDSSEEIRIHVSAGIERNSRLAPALKAESESPCQSYAGDVLDRNFSLDPLETSPFCLCQHRLHQPRCNSPSRILVTDDPPKLSAMLGPAACSGNEAARPEDAILAVDRDERKLVPFSVSVALAESLNVRPRSALRPRIGQVARSKVPIPGVNEAFCIGLPCEPDRNRWLCHTYPSTRAGIPPMMHHCRQEVRDTLHLFPARSRSATDCHVARHA